MAALNNTAAEEAFGAAVDAQAQDAFEAGLSERIARFQSDKPTIAEGLKNMVSWLLAEGLTAGPEEASTTPPVTSPVLLSIARRVATHVNKFEILASPQWGLQHPQGEDEDASTRLEALADYNCCATLCRQIKNNGKKNTSLFGRRFFAATRCWDAVANATRQELTGPGVPEEVLNAFLERFGASITGSDEDLASIIWSVNLKQTMQVRQEQRKQEATERTTRMGSVDVGIQEVKSALSSNSEAAPPAP